MSQMLQTLLDDIKGAMKARETERLSTLRVLHSEVKNLAIDERRDPTDEDVMAVLSRNLKQKRDAMAQFAQGGRQDPGVPVEMFESANLYRFLRGRRRCRIRVRRPGRADVGECFVLRRKPELSGGAATTADAAASARTLWIAGDKRCGLA